MNTITLQQTSLAIARYCEMKGRPVFAMDFNREVCKKINAGVEDEFLQEIALLANRVLKPAPKVNQVKRVTKGPKRSAETKERNVNDLIELVTKYPRNNVKFYHSKNRKLSKDYTSRLFAELTASGKLTREWKFGGNVYEVAK